MSFANSQNFTVDRSVFYDIRGDYHYSTTAPGERGIAELFKASCPDGFHDSQARYPPPRCLLGTRVALLGEVFDWIKSSDMKLLWLSGPAGAGKSAIAQTVAEACVGDSTLAASFFFFYGAPGRNSSDRLISSIVYQLAIRAPEKRTQIGKIVEADPSILHKPLELQIQALLLPLFIPIPPNKMHADASLSHPRQPYLIIIDGLDECKGDNSQRDVVRCIGKLANTDGIPLRFMIVSRPEPQIEESFGHLAGSFHSISLGDRHRVSQSRWDICAYLRCGFDEIYRKRALITEHFWPTEDTMLTLVDKAGETFIYASTVLKYVDDDDFDPVERLAEIFDTPPGLTPFAELDHLYCRILDACPHTERLLQVLTITCICVKTSLDWPRGYNASCSLCVQDIELLLRLRRGTIAMVLRRMCSVLYISTSAHITFYHKSFRDFLHNRERAGTFFIDVQGGNAFAAQKFLELLRCAAETNHCGLALTTSVVRYRPLAATCDLINYAKYNWYKHCAASGSWDEHPHLLEEISKTLDYYPLFPSVVQGSYNRSLVIRFFQWFDSEAHKTRSIFPKHDPLEIQYQLFKNLWRHLLNESASKPFCIYSFYDDVNIHSLMGLTFGPFQPYSLGRILPSFIIFNSPIHTWECWVSVENRPPPSDEDRDGWYLQEVFDPLVKRLLREPGSLEEYDMDVVKGHISVVHRCLSIIQSPSLPKQEYVYARKYWIRHLSNVPCGDTSILYALRDFQHQNAVNTLTMDEIRGVRTWLEASGVTPYGAWCSGGRKGNGQSEVHKAG